MRFLVDECAGLLVVRRLRDIGHDVSTPIEDGPGTPDSDLLEQAWSESRVLITNDKGFGDLIFRDGMPHAGVLLLRLADEHPAVKIAVIERVIGELGDDLARRFVVASETTHRVAPEP